MERPRIVVTLSSPERAANPEVARLKNQRYLDSVQRAGGDGPRSHARLRVEHDHHAVG